MVTDFLEFKLGRFMFDKLNERNTAKISRTLTDLG